jgi:hypothetical protein
MSWPGTRPGGSEFARFIPESSACDAMERPGHVTAETTAAIRNYQSIAGLAPDGRPSAELLASLRAVAGRDAPR